MNFLQTIQDNKNDRLLTFFRHQKYTDCTFKVDEKQFQAHSIVLACSSPVFEKMFYGELASPVVELGDVRAEEFGQLLDFIYTDKINLKSIMNAWSMVYVAKKYLMDDLAKVCLSYISNNLTMSTLVLSYEYADLYNIEHIKQRCIRDIVDGVTGVFYADYHMKPSTLRSILKEDLFISKIDLVCKIAEWAMNECDLRGWPMNPESIVRILKDEDVLRYVNKSVLLHSRCEYCNDVLTLCQCVNDVVHKTLNYLASDVMWEEKPPDNESVAGMVPFICKSRNIYKIARRIDLRGSEEFVSSVRVYTDMLVSGLLVNTEMNQTMDTSHVYNGCVRIRFCEHDSDKELVKPAIMRRVLPYDFHAYIPLRYPVTLSKNKIYDIRISYQSAGTFSSVVCNYMSSELIDRTGFVQMVFYEPHGTLIKGVSSYPV